MSGEGGAGDDQDVPMNEAAGSSTGDVVKSRLLDRLKKTGERSRENKLKEEQRAQLKDTDTKAKAAAVVAIPKKQSVPRQQETATGTSSLLSGMAVPPEPGGNKANPSKPPNSVPSSPKPRPNTTSNGRSTAGGEVGSGKKRPPPRSSSSTHLDLTTSTPPPINPDIGNSTVVATTKGGSRPNVSEAATKKTLLQDRVWESLAELCQKMDALEHHPFRLGPAALGATVDLSASFLHAEREYDWFDLDKNGHIVIQPRVPIFPEDFPPGMPEWPLSWWGIVDPAVGDRKDPKVVTTSGKPVDLATTKEERPSSSHSDRRDRSRSRDRRDRGSVDSYAAPEGYSRPRRSSSRSRDRNPDHDRHSSRRGHRGSERGSHSNSIERNARPLPAGHGSNRGMDQYGPPPSYDDRRGVRNEDRRSSRDRRFADEPLPRGMDRPRYPPEGRLDYRVAGRPPPDDRHDPSYRGGGDDRGRYGGGSRYSDERRPPHRGDEPRRDDRAGKDRGPRHHDDRRGRRIDDR